MAGVTGLEPAASGVTGQRSNQLSYTPFKGLLRKALAAKRAPDVLPGLAHVKEPWSATG